MTSLKANITGWMDRQTRLKEAVGRDLKDRLGELGLISLQTLIDYTEIRRAIDTGAYIANHHIEGEGGETLANEDRPSPTEEYQRGAQIFDPPDLSSVREDVAFGWQGGPIHVTNGRFYEQLVADNHEIYDVAYEIVKSEAEVVARRPSVEPEFSATRYR